MIFDRIVLHNFGTYMGRQVFELTPPPERPVILVGGLNGGGKTTFLDSIHLVLYGKRARCSNRGQLGYEEFLQRCINRRIPAHEGASIELVFRHREEGRENVYSIHRSWKTQGSGSTRESVQVSRNGEIDAVLTEHWDEYVDRLMPIGIANLFFFDGEKIEQLASPENATDILKTAIHSLLGLDLVDRLSADLLVFERRKQVQAASRAEQDEIADVQQKITDLEAERDAAVTGRASLQNDADINDKKLKDVNELFRREGGDHYLNRGALHARRAELEAEVKALDQSLREIAAGDAPLLLVRELIADVREQGERELDAQENRRFVELLARRDAAVLRAAAQNGMSRKALAALNAILDQDVEQRTASATAPILLDLHRDTVNELAHLLASLDGVAVSCQEALRSHSASEMELSGITRQLKSVPDDSTVLPILEQIQQLEQSRERLSRELWRYDEDLARLTREIAGQHVRLEGAIKRTREKALQISDDERSVRHSARVRETLKKFREIVLERNVARVADHILNSFRSLARKQSLVNDIRIRPSTLEIELFDGAGESVMSDRLSAGERQLLAIAILWGLARAADRQLPTIIDTPLGRLDGVHRHNLINNYFPYAGDQVILLSTDQEITEYAADEISDFVGHRYVLDFDDVVSATTVRSGYFSEVPSVS